MISNEPKDPPLDTPQPTKENESGKEIQLGKQHPKMDVGDYEKQLKERIGRLIEQKKRDGQI